MKRRVGMLVLAVLAVSCTRGEDGRLSESSASLTGPRTARCTPGGVKDESPPFAFTARDGEVVSSVCVKAGTQIFAFTLDNHSDGCYTTTGLNSRTATVTGGGTSRTCKDISHVVFYTAPEIVFD